MGQGVLSTPCFGFLPKNFHDEGQSHAHGKNFHVLKLGKIEMPCKDIPTPPDKNRREKPHGNLSKYCTYYLSYTLVLEIHFINSFLFFCTLIIAPLILVVKGYFTHFFIYFPHLSSCLLFVVADTVQSRVLTIKISRKFIFKSQLYFFIFSTHLVLSSV